MRATAARILHRLLGIGDDDNPSVHDRTENRLVVGVLVVMLVLLLVLRWVLTSRGELP